MEGAAAPSVDAAKEQAKKIRRAERLVAQGDEAAGQLKFDAAASRYRAALKIYEQNLAALEDPAPLVEVRLKLATALFRTDMEEEGERRLAEVVALAPEIELDPARYPPLFLRTFEGIRDKLLRLPRGAISVLSTPPGAAVYLDGRKVAETPALLTEVVRGPHYIRVEAAGVPPHVTRVDVDPKEVARVEAQLGGALSGEAAPLVAALAENEVDGKVVKALATLAKRAGAEFVVFGSIRKGEDVYDVKSFLYSRKSRKIAALTDIAFDFDLLGASIEVYKLAGEVAEAVQAFPSPLIVPAPIFPGVRAQKAKLTEVVAGPPVPRGPVAGASPAGAAPPPASAAAPAAPSGPVQPASGGPAEPVARGPVAPAAGGPVQPAAREPLTTSRGGPVAPVPATGGSAAAGPVRPARPV
ncbi:MAG: PEGA domain-containing protein, partial [Deltaproteobacteria bacterium]